MSTVLSALRKHWRRGEYQILHERPGATKIQYSSAPDDRSSIRNAPNDNAMFGSLRAESIGAWPSLSRIQDLPPELLAEIFYRYILLMLHTCARVGDPSPYAWLVIRHVCRAWRAVALAYPRLSSYIYQTRKLACVQDMLDRSGTAPLYVYDIEDDRKQFSMEAQRQMLHHLDRIVSARIAVHDSIPTPNPQGSQYPAVSILKTVSIHAESNITLSDPLFPGWVFPHLQDFTGRKISLSSFRTLLPPGLRRLSLNHCLPILLLDDLISLLKDLHQLEELVVRDTFTVSVPFESKRGTLPFRHSATLQCLKLLEVRNHCHVRGSLLLRRLVYPRSASVRLSFIGSLEDPSYNSELLVNSFLARFNFADCNPFIYCGECDRSIDCPLPQSMAIVSTIDEKLRVRLWTERLSLEELQAKSDTRDTACFCFDMTSPPASFLPAFLQRLPLTDIRSALLAEPGITGALPWRELFPLLPSLEGLSIQFARWPSLEYDIWKSAGYFVQDSPRSLFPALTVAQLKNLYFAMRHEDVANTHYISDLHILAHLLQSEKMRLVLARGKLIKIWTTSLDFGLEREMHLEDDFL
ncbi:uncharacterized protein PHACADRAFT_189449 [Phanerochaete carnosa HHB-10118-sp]|uniref:Uncharacterized protein n=1 Tax=Phanerochaete carnosa (strain HHB-10118-sp) TaxID=650164 RepID=K5VBN8_PHACS|nr:uncharacterized protein PHACADRAFT_189449 [Phanerochaete carnosa HHB-10118-sp]EKM60311.1 hypothetical protein PHACADRAFT_189449 [Phanerochaete carnosa HHB-10118-sp]